MGMTWLKRIVAPMTMLTALLLASPLPALAATGDSVYVEVDEPTSGETYVFHANISNNLEKSDTEDRLLTADTFIPVNRQGTSTTAFSFDDSDNLWANGNNLDQYEFEVTAVQGDTDEGNQGYQIRMTGKNVDDAQYLAVTQTVVETVRERSGYAYYLAYGKATEFDGVVYPTLPFVYLSSSPCTWYWDDEEGEFYTRYTSDIARSGTHLNGCMLDGTPTGTYYSYIDNDGNTYLIDWTNVLTYLDSDDPAYLGYRNLPRHNGSMPSSDSRISLIGLNAPVATNQLFSNSLAETLRNPLYVFNQVWPTPGVTAGCASLSVRNLSNIYGSFGEALGASVDAQSLTLYEKSDVCTLTVQDGSGGGSYIAGSTVQISASEKTDSGHFVRWDVVSGSATFEEASSASTSVTLSGSSVTVKAVYEAHAGTDDGTCMTALLCSTCGFEIRPASGGHSLGAFQAGSNGWHRRRCTNDDCTFEERQNCTYSTPTCTTLATCSVCGGTTGRVDPDNHEGKPVWEQTATTHKQVYKCCGAVEVAETNHTWEDGVCTVCNYACRHSGGTATCTNRAVCATCGEPYGDLAPDNHDPSDTWTQENGKHYHACQNGCGAHLDEASCSGGEESYFARPVCEVCGNEYGSLLTDVTPPAGEISIENDVWKSLLKTITFNHFFKETQTVEITATDDSYSMAGYTDDDAAQVAYLLDDSDAALTVDELEGMRFTEYTGPFNIEPDRRLVVYARITDHAGNVTYISSDGLVLDATPPAVTGVDNGGTYYATRAVDVVDENLDTVTLDGAPVTGGSFELTGNVDHRYVIVAIDRAGNVTEVTVTMKPIEDLAGQIEGLTPDTVDPDDRETVEAVKDAAEENLEDATDEERAELEDLIERCDELLKAIDAAEAAAAAEAEAARLAGTGDTLPVIAVCSLLVVGALAIAGGILLRRGSRF